tara:strand:+ start:1019 stop:1429 length:411 start_codon:yes stop_codon:yes gene_type:complete
MKNILSFVLLLAMSNVCFGQGCDLHRQSKMQANRYVEVNWVTPQDIIKDVCSKSVVTGKKIMKQTRAVVTAPLKLKCVPVLKCRFRWIPGKFIRIPNPSSEIEMENLKIEIEEPDPNPPSDLQYPLHLEPKLNNIS